MQSCELEEDQILRKLIGEYEDLFKTKEEQDERLEHMKLKNKELEENREQCDKDIHNQSENITHVTNQNNKTAKKIHDKKTQKTELET